MSGKTTPKRSLMIVLIGLVALMGITIIGLKLIQPESRETALPNEITTNEVSNNENPQQPARENVEVPNVLNFSEAQVREAAVKKHLKIEMVMGYSNQGSTHQVISQFPKAGVIVPANSTLRVRISIGTPGESVLGMAKTADNWRTYQGTWFSVDYPTDFKVRPGIKSSSGVGYDSAFFTSPDKTVEFYIYSPQWDGEPKDILLDSKLETLISHETKRAKSGKDSQGDYVHDVITKWFTAQAKDGSYTRSWLDVEDVGIHTRKTFGIKYRNQAAYDKYRSVYIHFKESLEQYAD